MRSFGRFVLCALLVVCGGIGLRAAGAETGSERESSTSKPVEWTFNGKKYRLPMPGHKDENESAGKAPVVAMTKLPTPKTAPAAAAATASASQPSGSSTMAIVMVAAVIVLALVVGFTSRKPQAAAPANEPATNAKGMVIEMNHDHAGTGVITITRRHRKATETIVEEKVREREAALAAQTTSQTEGPADDLEDPFASVPESPQSISERIVAKHTQAVTRRRASGE